MTMNNNTELSVESMPLAVPGNKYVHTVSVKGTFDYSSGEAVLSDTQLPIFYGDEMFSDEDSTTSMFESDILPYKPFTDIVLVGKAHAPFGKPVHTFNAELCVGEVKKSIKVFGDRTWEQEKKIKSLFRPSLPEPLKEIDIRYEKAFGGAAPDNLSYCAENLSGTGFLSKTSTHEEIKETKLPNIEDPDSVISKIIDHPNPAGFGFCGKTWKPRLDYMGTYDDEWRKNISPGLPEDFDYRYYNGAHPDLQADPHLKGDEEVMFSNLTPEEKTKFKLPGLIPTCMIKKQDMEVKKLKLNLDTLCFITEENQFYMVWRGVTKLSDMASLEVEEITVDITNNS